MIRIFIIAFICFHIGYAIGYRHGKDRGMYIRERQIDGCVDDLRNLRKLIK